MANETGRPRPPLEEPVPRDEIFASEVVSLSLLHNNIVVTFGTTRVDEPAPGAAPKPRRVVTARIVLTHVAAAQLIAQLQNLASQIEAARSTKGKTS